MATQEWVGKGLTCTIKGNGEVVEGEVYTYDKVTDTLVIKDHAVGLQEANYRFLKGNAIDPASVKLTGASRVPDATPPVATSTVERYASGAPLPCPDVLALLVHCTAVHCTRSGARSYFFSGVLGMMLAASWCTTRTCVHIVHIVRSRSWARSARLISSLIAG